MMAALAQVLFRVIHFGRYVAPQAPLANGPSRLRPPSRAKAVDIVVW